MPKSWAVISQSGSGAASRVAALARDALFAVTFRTDKSSKEGAGLPGPSDGEPFTGSRRRDEQQRAFTLDVPLVIEVVCFGWGNGGWEW